MFSSLLKCQSIIIHFCGKSFCEKKEEIHLLTGTPQTPSSTVQVYDSSPELYVTTLLLWLIQHHLHTIELLLCHLDVLIGHRHYPFSQGNEVHYSHVVLKPY